MGLKGEQRMTHMNKDAAAKIVATVRGIGEERLGELLDGLFDGADDALHKMAEQASTNDEHALLHDAMRGLRRQRALITEGFHEALAEVAHTGALPTANQSGDGEFDFSLMPPDLIDEEIACSNMANKANYRHRWQVGYIEDALGQLAEKGDIEIDRHALSPRTLTSAFQHAMTGFDMRLEIKLVIYKLFGQFVIDELETVYAPIADVLTEAGIERTRLHKPKRPEQKRAERVARQAESQARSSRAHTPGQAPGTVAAPDVAPSGAVPEDLPDPGYEGVSRAVARWLSRLHQPPASAPAGAGQAGASSATSASGGSPGQTGASSATGGSGGSPGQAGASSAPSVAGGSPGQTGRHDPYAPPPPAASANDHLFDAVDAIGYVQTQSELDMSSALAMLLDAFAALPEAQRETSTSLRRHLTRILRALDYLLQDREVTVAARKLIARARGPLLKTALFDEAFYEEPDHPSRNLLNELAALGAHLDDEHDPHYLEIRDLLDHLADEFENDPALVDLTYQRLCEIRVTRSKQLNRQGVIKRIRLRAVTELRQQLQDRHLPDDARPFLLKGFGPAMCLCDLRHGADSPEYRGYLGDARRIIDALQPAGDADPDARRAEVDRVQEIARTALHRMGMKRDRAESLLAGLGRALDWASATSPAYASNDTMFDLTDVWAAQTLKRDAQRRHDAAREGAVAHEPAANEPVADQAREAGSLPSSPVESMTPDIEEFLASTCKPRTWFKLCHGDSDYNRWLRVLSYDRKQGQVHFGNRRGDEVVVRGALAVAQGLQDGTIEPVYDIPGFESRLSQIISDYAAQLSGTP